MPNPNSGRAAPWPVVPAILAVGIIIVGGSSMIAHPGMGDQVSAPTVHPSEAAPEKALPFDMNKRAFLKEDAVACNFEPELIQHEIDQIRFRSDVLDRIEEGDTVGGCSMWGEREVHVFEKANNHYRIATMVSRSDDGTWNESLSAWISPYDIHN